jgi:hypothetical protein
VPRSSKWSPPFRFPHHNTAYMPHALPIAFCSIVQWLRLALSKGPNTVGVPLPLRTEADPVSETSCYLVILDFWTMDEVQKPITSQCYIPSSEPFRIYMKLLIMQFPDTSFLLGLKIFLDTLLSNTLSLFLPLNMTDCFAGTINVLYILILIFIDRKWEDKIFWIKW